MLKQLAELAPNNFFYYFDITFEETLKRHHTNPNADEFGEVEMSKWYKPHEYTEFPTEKIIDESLSVREKVDKILSETGV